MDPRTQKLISALESKGWKLIGPADVSSDWWFEEIYHFTSSWHPRGINIYLTVLVDPQFLDKKVACTFGISTTLPKDRHTTYVEVLSLNDITRTNLSAFVDRINKNVLVGR